MHALEKHFVRRPRGQRARAYFDSAIISLGKKMTEVLNDLLDAMFFDDLQTFDQKHIDDVPFELIRAMEEGEAATAHDFLTDG